MMRSIKEWSMARLNIRIGGDTFRRIRETQCVYIDKTSIIEEMLATTPPEVSLITRPRRFGKTLTMTMLQAFFDISTDNRHLFEGLKVMENPELCEKWMNQYPTVFLSLKDITGENYGSAIRQMKILITDICGNYEYLLESPKIKSTDRASLSLLIHGGATDELYMRSLLILSRALESHWGKPAILLIDEYDVPINYAEKKGYYEEMIGFMRNMLGSALKTNMSLTFAVLTGCLRIARESIFTGLNNFACFGISHPKYADKFGFTQQEVDSLLDDAGQSDKKALIQEWYDGYRFGNGTEIYCPWDVLFYISDLQIDQHTKPQAYWNNTSGNAIVRTLINRAGNETREKIETLISGGVIEENISEELTYDVLYQNEQNIWSVMYLTGYLTKAPKQPDNGNTALVIPNKEVRTIFTDTITQWFKDNFNKETLSPFVQALWDRDADTVQTTLRKILYSTISYYDNAENFYHGFVAGIIRGAGLTIRSNRESGLGRTDIVVEDKWNHRAIIIELKKAATPDDLEKKTDEALKQIEDRKYADGLPAQFKEILKYGMSFWEKECRVKIA